MLGDIARFLLLLMGWGGITYIISEYTYERGLEKGELATIEVVDMVLNHLSDQHGISLTVESENLVTGEVRVLGGGHVDPDS